MHGIARIVIVVLIIEIGWRFAGGHIIFGFLGASHSVSFPWIVRLLAFIGIGWRFCYYFGDTSRRAAIAGALAGVIIGLIIGLFEVMWYHNLKAWLSFFALPWQTLIVGTVVTWFSGYLATAWSDERRRYLYKQEHSVHENNTN